MQSELTKQTRTGAFLRAFEHAFELALALAFALARHQDAGGPFKPSFGLSGVFALATALVLAPALPAHHVSALASALPTHTEEFCLA
jgi:hypothetical protein